MPSYISPQLRRLVISRADNRCEYCLVHQQYTYFGCEVDHIVSIKHGGATEEANLAYACASCNRHKGSDLGSIAWQTGALIRFYNPRIDRWAEHFELIGARIKPLTDMAK